MGKNEVKTKLFKLNVFEVKMADTMSNFPLAKKTYDSLKKTGKVKGSGNNFRRRIKNDYTNRK